MHDPVFGPFRAEKDAWRAIEGKAREAGLCLKTLGLEAGEGSCFAYQVQEVPRRPASARSRARCTMHGCRLSLAPLKFKPWPFAGAIGIREPAPAGAGVQIHVIDRWRHLGTARDEDEVQALLRAAGRRRVRRGQLSHHRARVAGRAAARPDAVSCAAGVRLNDANHAEPRHRFFAACPLNVADMLSAELRQLASTSCASTPRA